MGLEVLAPDINESYHGFTVIPESDKIRFGLAAVKNVGENLVNEIVSQRKSGGKFRDIFDFMERINPKVINRKSLEALIKAGVFDAMAERNTLLANIENFWRSAGKTKKQIQRPAGAFRRPAGGQDQRPFVIPRAPGRQGEKLMWEKELLGLFVTSHPLEEYRGEMEKNA